MRRIVQYLAFAGFVTGILCAAPLRAQQAAVDLLQKAPLQYAQGYSAPLGNLFSAVFNSGQCHTADVGSFHVYASLQLTGAFIPSSEKTFSPTLDLPIGGTIVHTHLDNVPTILGGRSNQFIVDTTINGQKYQIQAPPGIDQSYVPLIVPHIEIGTFLNTELILRGIPNINTNSKIGTVSFYGIGLRHSLSNYIPLLPVNLSVQLMFQHLGVGDIATMNAWNGAVLASIDLPGVTVYAGLQAEQAKLHLQYSFTAPAFTQQVSMDINSTNNVRFTLGGTMKLLIVYINAQATFAEYTTLGLGVGVRIPPSI